MDRELSQDSVWPPRHPDWSQEDPNLGLVVQSVSLPNGTSLSVGENYVIRYGYGAAGMQGIAHILAVHPSSKTVLAWWFYTRGDFDVVADMPLPPLPSLDGKP